MNFLENIFAQLDAAGDSTVLWEIHDQEAPQELSFGLTGGGLLTRVAQARAFLLSKGLKKKGDRCALLAHNGIDWVALDLAIMAEGVIVVPLYARQAPAELVAMMKDCSPALICCGDAALRDGILQAWPEAPPQYLFDEIFSHAGASVNGNPQLAESDPVTIIYTSGTSGEAKGVILTAGNVGHMLGCTSGRLDLLMESKPGQDRVFHYLPFCFAGSWIMLLTCLLRRSLLTLNTDLGKLAGEMRAAAPDYFLNVPALLERMRKAVDEQLWKTGGLALTIYSRAKAAWMRKREGRTRFTDPAWLGRCDDLSHHPQENDWRQPESPDLRLGAPEPGHTTLFQYARYPRAAGLWADRDHRNLHHGRSAPCRTGTRGTGDQRHRNEAGRERRDHRARPEYFSRILEPSAGNRQVAARRLVSYRRPGRSRCGRELAYYRAHQEPDHSGFGPQHCARSPSRTNCCEICPAPNRSCWWATGAGIFR